MTSLQDGQRLLGDSIPHMHSWGVPNLSGGHGAFELGVLIDCESDDIIGVFQVERLRTCNENNK